MFLGLVNFRNANRARQLGQLVARLEARKNRANARAEPHFWVSSLQAYIY